MRGNGLMIAQETLFRGLSYVGFMRAVLAFIGKVNLLFAIRRMQVRGVLVVMVVK